MSTIELEKKKNILIVDDELSYAKSLAIGLRRAGYQSQIANSGLEGEKKIRDTDFNFILCDINMPEMDGWEFASKVKTLTSAEFIFITADSRITKKKEFDQYSLLTKPIDLAELLQLLEKKTENNQVIGLTNNTLN